MKDKDGERWGALPDGMMKDEDSADCDGERSVMMKNHNDDK